MLLLQYVFCSCVHLAKSLQTGNTKGQKYRGDPDEGRQHLCSDAHWDSGNPAWQLENAPVTCLSRFLRCTSDIAFMQHGLLSPGSSKAVGSILCNYRARRLLS